VTDPAGDLAPTAIQFRQNIPAHLLDCREIGRNLRVEHNRATQPAEKILTVGPGFRKKEAHAQAPQKAAHAVGLFLFDIAIEMEPEDGLIWVLRLEDESVMAFTDFGVDSLVELVKIHREMTPRAARGA
jgi:hypothetical protein